MDLQQKRVVITRPRAQAGEFAAALEGLGAQTILFPVIEIRANPDTQALDRAIQKLGCYDWVVLTSVNAVEVFLERWQAQGVQQIPANLRFAAIGPKTAAALQDFGIRPDFTPEEFVAEAVLPGLGDLAGRWVLMPRAELARPTLPQAIQEGGGIAHEITAYFTLPAAPDETALEALRQGVDVVTFTSASTVNNFVLICEQAGLEARNLPGKPALACIGPVTAGAAQELGLPVALVAKDYTTKGLLEAIKDYQPAVGAGEKFGNPT